MNTETVWCSGGAVLSDYKDFSPFVTADFEKNPTLVGVGLKGAPAAQKQNGYPSFQVYHMVEDGKYNAVREGNRNNMVVKVNNAAIAQWFECSNNVASVNLVLHLSHGNEM